MIITDYKLFANIDKQITVALVADLHDRPFKAIKRAFSNRRPDLIAVAGDLIDGRTDQSRNGLDFLRYASGVAPTVYSLGNHERFYDDSDCERIEKTGAVALFDSNTVVCGINVGGLTSGYYNVYKHRLKQTPEPNLRFLDEFSASSGYKLLLCHHPEYYDRYLKQRDIDLVLSGHAHGGQIQLLGHGLFSPGQGVFPKITHGIYDNRLIISRGISNTVPFPRIGNPTELIYITLTNKSEEQ